MLTEEQLEIYGGVLVPVFQQLEQDIIADIARRVFDEQLRWTGHSHPTTMNLRASDDDRKTLAVFKWQKKSTIVDLTGKTIPFSTNMFDDVYK